ncbi:PGF-CTERM sorting domain-containing protein [Haloglomus litoreum]|uniref:PGF-CTERM sorting domain-containing protein n=1 Tax=Haloglomus litoreum TaxID=3034026 RepID=UPI0023E7C8E1|nr:PGF-CTERM sorting domain-containing protein [Haloglomus sp. DT116]
MTRCPPLRVALLATILVLAPVAAVGATPTAAPPEDGPTDRSDPPRSIRDVQSDETVLNVTVVGRTATNAGVPTMVNVTSVVATDLDLDPARVRVDRTGDTVEVLANRSDAAILAALREADVDTDDVVLRRGVSNETRDAVVTALRERVAAAGLDGTSVTASGDSRIRIRTTAVDGVRSLVTVRGDVALVAGFPGADGPRRAELVDASGIATVGAVQERPGGAPYVPVTLTEAAARNFSGTLVERGLTDSANTSGCRYSESPDAPGYCIFTVVDGEIVYAASLSAGLADIVRSGEFVEDPRFIVTAANESTARRLATALRTGPLPAPVRVVNRTVPDGAAVATPANGSAAPGTSPTPSPTPVVDGTPTASPTDPTAAAGDDGSTGGTSTGGQSGFGPVLAVSALLAAAGLLRRRQRP